MQAVFGSLSHRFYLTKCSISLTPSHDRASSWLLLGIPDVVEPFCWTDQVSLQFKDHVNKRLTKLFIRSHRHSKNFKGPLGKLIFNPPLSIPPFVRLLVLSQHLSKRSLTFFVYIVETNETFSTSFQPIFSTFQQMLTPQSLLSSFKNTKTNERYHSIGVSSDDGKQRITCRNVSGKLRQRYKK